MRVTIVGVRKSESKGRAAFNYFGLKDFTDYDIQNSECNGQSVVAEFSYTDFNLKPGDVVEFDYEPGFQGRATLVGVRPVSLVADINPFDGDKNNPAADATPADEVNSNSVADVNPSNSDKNKKETK